MTALMYACEGYDKKIVVWLFERKLMIYSDLHMEDRNGKKIIYSLLNSGWISLIDIEECDSRENIDTLLIEAKEILERKEDLENENDKKDEQENDQEDDFEIN